MGKRENSFSFDWVLINELAVGSAPKNNNHTLKLKDYGIKSIFSLCSEKEANPPEGIKEEFITSRLVLPDHKVNKNLEKKDLLLALKILAELKVNGPVFVHCVASIERSPLICMAWLVHDKGLSPQRSLDYLSQVHPLTNPLPRQYKLLFELN